MKTSGNLNMISMDAGKSNVETSILNAGTKGRDMPDQVRADSGSKSRVLKLAIGLVNVELIFLAAWAFVDFGSISSGIDFLSGDRVLAEPRVLSFGALNVGDYHMVDFRVDNRTNHAIRLRGASRSSMCSILRRFPISVGPGQRTSIPIAIQPAMPSPVGIAETLLLLTDDATQPVVKITIKGKVHMPPRQTAGAR